MVEKPELIAFSQNKIGGVQNFYFNILSNDPGDLFDKKWIFLDSDTEVEAKLPQPYNVCHEIVFHLNRNETTYQLAERLQELISKREGAILVNFSEELATLHIYRRQKKTIFFICHDEWYLKTAIQFAFLIDVFIAHNIEFYERMVALFPGREKDVYYLPYGVHLQSQKRKENHQDPLRIVFLARLTKNKGIYDLPSIQGKLASQGIAVQWTIIGDGPEKEELKCLMADNNSNVNYYSPSDSKGVLELLKQQDVYILPSRLDGLPVSMLEAMSVGCVPVISEFNQGIKKILPPTAGYVLPVGDIDAFANTIAVLHQNRNELEKRSILSKELIEKEYDIGVRARQYFDLFAQYKSLKKPRRFRLFRYGNILNHPLVPEIILRTVKKIKNNLAPAQSTDIKQNA